MAGFKDFLQNNNDALAQMGLGLLSGRNAQEQLALGASGLYSGRKEQKTRNATLSWMKDNAPELGSLMESGAISPTDAVKMAWQQRQALRSAKAENPFMSVGGHVFNRDTQEWISPPGGADGSGSGELGLQPIWAQDEGGNYIPLQPSKQGGFIRTETPEGLKLLGPYGTEYDKAQGKAMGGAQGNAQVALPGYLQEAERSQALIDEMISHPGRATATGASSTWDPRNYLAGTDATDFNSKAAQLQGKTFLQAYENLRGAGQITEVEGKKAEQAIANLNSAQSDEQYLRALQDLKTVIDSGVANARAKADGNFGGGGSPSPMTGGGSAGQTQAGAKWRIK